MQLNFTFLYQRGAKEDASEEAIEASSSYFYGIWLLFATYCYLNILFATNHGLGRSVKVYTRIDFLLLY
ncbi:hypothetical protein [Planktothricoides raciborskii]|uniref:Uncharacterized protein n=1 Tax=Planktothricoides raciborskii FACHB-1370 TaxID=2949576 RepID=A0ABR8E9C7_9CYAN|nr:hypothetical protein [Planktothricoides raciborskii]MBD2542977.1 hypothetical protein [Planktothricoides raciborskii FACHB-1370]MBD2581855.1 hypothetical protein [Planktothricoides raciborskii FACHB-1261]